ncbi:hypothetical protein [Rhodospirillaceae bacterium SYSU D60014]|uniref:hypothetical protein n=1 Tax=Virgifigura deserti TaxID=2268457 RepID=UPI000E6751B5
MASAAVRRIDGVERHGRARRIYGARGHATDLPQRTREIARQWIPLFFAGNDLLAVSSFDPGLELATTGVHWLTGLPLVGAQILVVLLARSSSDKTRLIPLT